MSHFKDKMHQIRLTPGVCPFVFCPLSVCSFVCLCLRWRLTLCEHCAFKGEDRMCSVAAAEYDSSFTILRFKPLFAAVLQIRVFVGGRLRLSCGRSRNVCV